MVEMAGELRPPGDIQLGWLCPRYRTDGDVTASGILRLLQLRRRARVPMPNSSGSDGIRSRSSCDVVRAEIGEDV